MGSHGRLGGGCMARVRCDGAAVAGGRQLMTGLSATRDGPVAHLVAVATAMAR